MAEQAALRARLYMLDQATEEQFRVGCATPGTHCQEFPLFAPTLDEARVIAKRHARQARKAQGDAMSTGQNGPGLCTLCGRRMPWLGKTLKCVECLAKPVAQPTPAEVLDSAPPAVRHDSRQGSRDGAAAAAFRATSQKAHLLRTWADHPDGLTDEEAAAATPDVPERSCYWKRAGELRELGLLRFTGTMRTGTMGVEREVSVITDEGRAMVARLRTPERNTA